MKIFRNIKNSLRSKRFTQPIRKTIDKAIRKIQTKLPVKRQKGGTCGSISMLSLFEYVVKKCDPKKKIKMSEEYAHQTIHIMYNTPKKEVKHSGIYIEDFLFASKIYGCRDTETQSRHEILKYGIITETDSYKLVETVKMFLTNRIPLNIYLNTRHRPVNGLIVPKSIYDFQYRPIYRQKRGGHYVNLVGFDNDRQEFIYCNSWGKDWGDSGYGSLPYSYVADIKKINSELDGRIYFITTVQFKGERYSIEQLLPEISGYKLFDF